MKIYHVFKICFIVLFVLVLTSFDSFSSIHKTTFPIYKNLKIGDYAPNFILKGADGKTHRLSEYKGKIVILDFWAMWCGPCKDKMPKIQLLHQNYRSKDVEVMGILTMNEGAEESAKEHFKSNNYTFKLLYGNQQLNKDYQLQFLPTVIVVDKKGKIIYLTTKPNPNEFQDIKALIKKHY